MNADTLTLLSRIAIGPVTMAELITATGIKDAAGSVATLLMQRLVESERRQGSAAIYSVTFRGKRYLTAQAVPMGEVAGPRIPYPTAHYTPQPWIPPRELTRRAA